MQSSIKNRLLCSIGAIGMLLSMSPAVSAEVAVIVHPSNNVALDKAEIERIFLGKSKAFSSGETAIPTNLAAGAATRSEFEDKVLGRTSAQVNAYWAKLVFTGKGTKPKELDSDGQVTEFVAGNVGAIAYVAASSVTGNVKVVATF
ncbi:phosphate ABC transporter substrate-binding protein [Pseudoalteromonas xiamenensis]